MPDRRDPHRIAVPERLGPALLIRRQAPAGSIRAATSRARARASASVPGRMIRSAYGLRIAVASRSARSRGIGGPREATPRSGGWSARRRVNSVVDLPGSGVARWNRKPGASTKSEARSRGKPSSWNRPVWPVTASDSGAGLPQLSTRAPAIGRPSVSTTRPTIVRSRTTAIGGSMIGSVVSAVTASLAAIAYLPGLTIARYRCPFTMGFCVVISSGGMPVVRLSMPLGVVHLDPDRQGDPGALDRPLRSHRSP